LEQIETFYNKRLWHQLTISILEFVQRPDTQSKLLEFNSIVLKDIENRINHLQLVEIVIHVIRNVENMDQAIEILDILDKKVSSNKEASNLIAITKSKITLDNSPNEDVLKKVRDTIRALSPELEKFDGVSPVHSRFYEMAAQYYSLQQDHELFYRNTLRYLGCREDPNSEFDQSFEQLGFKLCLAALLADKVFNFGELLQHKIVTPVRNGPNAWIAHLVDAFNSGDIRRVTELSSSWQAQPDLLAAKEKLMGKLTLSALMELVFVRPAKNRSIQFEDISKATGLPKDEVEWLVMRALSLNLVRGTIDQVNSTATLTWVQPRVLDSNQITKMQNRVQCWVSEVKNMEATINSRTAEMVKF